MIFSRGDFEIDVTVSGFLECKAKGFPVMDFTWQIYPGQPQSFFLSPGRAIDDFTVTKTTYSSKTEIGVSHLMINKVKKKHHGIYKCIASTKEFKTVKEIVLTGIGTFP